MPMTPAAIAEAITCRRLKNASGGVISEGTTGGDRLDTRRVIQPPPLWTSARLLWLQTSGSRSLDRIATWRFVGGCGELPVAIRVALAAGLRHQLQLSQTTPRAAAS